MKVEPEIVSVLVQLRWRFAQVFAVLSSAVEVPWLDAIVIVGVPIIVPAVTIFQSIRSPSATLTEWVRSLHEVAEDGLKVQVSAVSAPLSRSVTVKPVLETPSVALIAA